MSDEHQVFESKSQPSPGTGVIRYRAFCKCGWVSHPTLSVATYNQMVAAHIAETGGAQ